MVPLNSIQALVQLDDFLNFMGVASSPNRWQGRCLGSFPHSAAALPLDWLKFHDMSPFTKLPIVTPDRMATATTNTVGQALPNGKRGTQFDGENSFYDVPKSSRQNANPMPPLGFILSAGANPFYTAPTLATKEALFNNG
jgi:hypothetical protein